MQDAPALTFAEFAKRHAKYETTKQHAAFQVYFDLHRVMSQFQYKATNTWSRNFNFTNIEVCDCEKLQRYVIKCTSECDSSGSAEDQNIRYFLPLFVAENFSCTW